MARYSDAISRLKHETSFYMHKIYWQTVANLTGQSENPRSLTGKHYDEKHMLSLHLQANDRTTLCNLYSNRLFVCYLFQKYSEAVENAAMAKKYLDSVVGFIGVPLFHFYDSLARLAVFVDSKKSEQRSILKKVAVNQKKMRKWARHAPMNHLHKFYLVEAERMRVLGKDAKAKKYYDKAIELAKANEYINEESLANELAARFYLEKGNTKIARAYMQDARYGYLRWGATAKVKDLDSRYGQLLVDRSSLTAITETKKPDFTVTTTEMGAGEGLDLSSVMKASQAISGEIVLDKLLGRLINIVIENAGAQKGALVLESGGKLLIEAEGKLEQDNVSLLHSVPIEESNNLSPAIVNYVARTREYVVLNNAVMEGRFTNDPYILTCRPKSVLCAPIIHKSVLSGILYLENNLITDAFTIERMEMLKLLSSQIATSLENARLYKNLEVSELRYRELYENIVDIVILVGVDDKILMANPRFYSTIGIPYTTGKEFTFKKWVHADDVLQVGKQMLPRLLDGSEVKDFEFRIVNRHGMVFDVECNAKRIKKGDDLVGFQMVIRDITERKRLANQLIDSLKDIENARSGTILGLAKLAEYRDEETGAHLERIREYARIIARALAEKPEHKNYITEQYIEDIYCSSILHDIGKVGIPDAILLKPGKLDPEEFEVIKRHPVIGGDVLKAVNAEVGGRSFVTLGMQIAYFHHEKWNGTGYPNGLKGKDIPLSARIVALPDVYDALTSKRVYKEAYTHEKAKGIIIAENGKHFDPEVVGVFLAHEEEFNAIRKEMHNGTCQVPPAEPEA